MQQCERHWEERSYAMREIKKERKKERQRQRMIVKSERQMQRVEVFSSEAQIQQGTKIVIASCMNCPGQKRPEMNPYMQRFCRKGLKLSHHTSSSLTLKMGHSSLILIGANFRSVNYDEFNQDLAHLTNFYIDK